MDSDCGILFMKKMQYYCIFYCAYVYKDIAICIIRFGYNVYSTDRDHEWKRNILRIEVNE